MASFQTRLTPEMTRRHTQAGYWREETFYSILERRAAAHPDRELLYDRRQRLTYREVYDRVNAVAARLEALGIGPGDVVTIQLPSWFEFACAFFAVECVGGIAIQISTDFRATEVRFILEFSESAAYICATEFRGFRFLPMVEALRPDLPRLRLVCVIDGDGSDAVASLRGAMNGAEPAGDDFEPVRMGANDVYRMAFTSGTTGNPKAVIHSHNTTLSACHIQNTEFDIDAADVFLLYLPLGLNWGYLALVQTVIAGARAVLLDRFAARTALELIDEERVTYIPTAPASIIAMLDEPELDRFDTSSLRLVISGGAVCPVETIRQYQARMKGQFIELYGMLETGFHTYTRVTDDPEAVNGTVGKPADGLEMCLLDPDGNPVPPGEEGEIAAKGPSVHLGYHKNPRANAEAFTEEGWFRTGDLGIIDEAGNLTISGRNKEIVNRGGKKFHPREIEEILYTNPKVLHAAIVGVPDPRLGERNCLCVIPRAGQELTLDEAVAMLEGRVATYKLPEMLRVFDEFPFTPTGKLQRHRLVEMVREAITSPR